MGSNLIHAGSTNSLLLLSLTLWLCCSFSYSHLAKLSSINCTFIEREALMAFKQSLIDPSARLSSWVGENCCSWPGITCDIISGKVTKIDLQNSLGFDRFRAYLDFHTIEDLDVGFLEYKNSCLGGEISPSLLQLKYLNYLDLSLNNFEGALIPYFFGMLKNLRYLNLSSTYFGGEIPLNLGNLSKLNYLDLSASNQYYPEAIRKLSAKDLHWLSELSSLKYLNIGWVNLSNVQAGWMYRINMLSSLEVLQLQGCGISSFDTSIPFVNLSSLKVFDLSWNGINVSLPLWLSNLSSLIILDLHNNEFQGIIPQDLVKLKNLQYLDLSQNGRLRVENLHWLSGFSSLEYLNIGYVNLSSVRANWMHTINKLSSLVELSLQGCGISSFDSSIHLVNLTFLRVLDLSENLINTSLPMWLSNLTSLTVLNLRQNEGLRVENLHWLSGLSSLKYLDIGSVNLRSVQENWMHAINRLSSLVELHLSGCGISSFDNSIPFVNLTSLRVLDLSKNLINASIPLWLSNLTGLITLDLHHNNMGVGGQVPSFLRNLCELRSLNLASNKFSKLDEFLGSSSNCPDNSLESLDLSDNELVGEVPNSLGTFENLRLLDLSYNKLLGSLPSSMGNLSLLQYLDVSYNLLNGTIPKEWNSSISSQIICLDLSNNFLKGKLSHLLASRKVDSIDQSNNLLEDLFLLRYNNLIFLYLQNNLFSGPIPSNIGDSMPNLITINLSKNYLNGTIPSSIQKMSRLQVLSLSNNQLSGELLDYWSKFKSLCVIDLANNSLSGVIPSSIGLLTSLDKLILSNNYLYGEIPRSLHNCSLTSIDLSENRLYGNLPLWRVGVASKLSLLNLRSNLFRGTIPRQWCNLPLLRILDLSNNNLSGEIPSCLYNWTTLIYGNFSLKLDSFDLGGRYFGIFREKAILTMKGRSFEYDTNLKYVLSIDLSRNRLCGKIPNEITKLIHLVALNLSSNDLVGSIPENIGAMQQLETLDLSCNHLSGQIPNSLASLTFLAHLNLSFNNLVGRIPTSMQLQTLDDPSIYEGNPSLCGSPLLTMCPGDKNTNSTPILRREGHGEKNDSKMLGFYISMTIGFPVGLNIMLVTILIKESWRASYFGFIDRINYKILQKMGLY